MTVEASPEAAAQLLRATQAKKKKDKAEDKKDADSKKSDTKGKPKRVSNPKHHPKSDSPEPANVEELFDESIADEDGVRWAKDSDGTIHRFSKPSNGETHWNGSTSGASPIDLQNVPIAIRRRLGAKLW